MNNIAKIISKNQAGQSLTEDEKLTINKMLEAELFKEQFITLDTGDVIKYSLKKMGQCPPSISDNVFVRLSIFLPVGNLNDIPNVLQFKKRVELFEAPLSWGWGESEGNYKYRGQNFEGTKYIDAALIALKYLEIEVLKLTDAIAIRQAILRNA